MNLHELVMDVGGVDEGDSEAMERNQLLGELQGRSHVALRRMRDEDCVQPPLRRIRNRHLRSPVLAENSLIRFKSVCVC